MIRTTQSKEAKNDPYRNFKLVTLFLVLIFILFGWILQSVVTDNDSIERFRNVHNEIRPYPESDLSRTEEDNDLLDGDIYLQTFYEIDPNVTNESLQYYFKDQLTRNGWRDIEDVSKYICGLRATKDNYDLEILCERKYWYNNGTTIKISEYGFLTSIDGREEMYYYEHSSTENLERILNLIRSGDQYGGVFGYSIKVDDTYR